MRSFTVLCSLAALVCVFVISIKAKPEMRQKRALNQENCPPNMTHEQCEAWAAQKSANQCVRHEIMGTHIEWADCGRALCGDNTREVPADLSKPYPDCCPHCETIDPSKPGVWSRLGK